VIALVAQAVQASQQLHHRAGRSEGCPRPSPLAQGALQILRDPRSRGDTLCEADPRQDVESSLFQDASLRAAGADLDGGRVVDDLSFSIGASEKGAVDGREGRLPLILLAFVLATGELNGGCAAALVQSIP
jgi:hypothetical protein